MEEQRGLPPMPKKCLLMRQPMSHYMVTVRAATSTVHGISETCNMASEKLVPGATHFELSKTDAGGPKYALL